MIGAWAILFLLLLVGLFQFHAYLAPGVMNHARILIYRTAYMLTFPMGINSRIPRTTIGLIEQACYGATLWCAIGYLFARMRRSLQQSNDAIKPVTVPSPISRPIQPRGTAWTRRKFLRVGLESLPVIATGAGAMPILYFPGRLQLRRYEIPIRNLPSGLDGLKIAHLSDFHLGHYISVDHVVTALKMIRAERSDLSLVTGDYVQGNSDGFEVMAGLISEYARTPLGIQATLGNHDHWHGPELCRKHLRAAGITLIENTRQFLGKNGWSTEPSRDTLCIAGLGDKWEGIVDFKSALKGVPPEMPRVVLSHNPDTAETFVPRPDLAPRIDLMLSGHTHGGQVSLPYLGAIIVPSAYGQKYAGGLVSGPHWPVLVSRGIGMALIPVRWRVPPEVSLITLRRGG